MIFTDRGVFRVGDLVEIISPGKNYMLHPNSNLVKEHSELAQIGKTFTILKLDYVEKYQQWRVLGNLDGKEYVSFAIDGLILLRSNNLTYEIF